ncbi:acetyl-CoA carboxylase biotin carboxyl carrier protein subunit [Paenibacillus sp. D2_2]|uniref:acetyl-CoA carboxylase biotin carboxyl carrier protein subunit n=1 Tax=Paenibacillus sp. D2_2 TaxID=3073092 RepID=UPI0028162492|nr:acetyl-CoA carboxylase biotin carboxyl carrier protein subunit [Paenibacillus sp. D2_2]WMT43095.1 acetyl-CoA carboxylase biotin carboxyl carrier protein subunit [Paenibacillus sp. D2_2]
MIIKLEQITGHANRAKIGKLNVTEGDQIEIGQPLLQMESKKGNSPVVSKYKGKIDKVLVEEDQEIELGQSLFEVTTEGLAKETAENKPKLDYFSGLLRGKKEDVRTELLIIGAGPGAMSLPYTQLKRAFKLSLWRRIPWGNLPECRMYSDQSFDKIL